MQQAYEPIRVQVLFDPALIDVLDAYRRAAEGLPSRSEVIRQAVLALASPARVLCAAKPRKSRSNGHKPPRKSR